MLDVLPPFSQEHKQWVYYSPASRNYARNPAVAVTKMHPVCLHDVLVASHSTACQHNSLFFAHYHRHLTINLQLFLNFAHEIMTNGLQNLQNTYPLNQSQLYGSPKQLQAWKSAFEAYKANQEELKGANINYIAAHYWNPCNYRNDNDLICPIQLKTKAVSEDPVDNLCFVIRKSYPWNINVATRWYNTDKDKQKDRIFNGVYTGRPFKHNYSKEEDDILNAKMNLRNTKPSKLFPLLIGIKEGDYYQGGLLNHIGNHVSSQNYQECKNMQPQKMNFPINRASDQELKIGYFSKSTNNNYIGHVQGGPGQGNLNYPNDSVQEINGQMPHYQFASAFIGSKAYKDKNGQLQGVNNIKQFLWQSNPDIQASHNSMHNNFRTMMNDPLYSITSLVFFVYHSWIDLMFQFKIRQANSRQNGDATLKLMYDNALIKSQLPFSVNGGSSLTHVFNDNIKKQSQETQLNLSNLFSQAVKKSSIAQKIDFTKVGSYPIPQWVNPDIRNLKRQPEGKDFSFAFFAIQYALQNPYSETNYTIRDSRSIGDIYKHYVSANSERFKNFKGFQTFNFNFNYQVYDIDNKGVESKYTLDELGILPSYIQDIINNAILPLNEKYIEPQNEWLNSQINLIKSQRTVQNLRTQRVVEKITQRKVQKHQPVQSRQTQVQLLQTTSVSSVRSVNKQVLNSQLEAELNQVAQNQIDDKVLNLRKLINSQFTIFIEHPSSLKNGSYPIKIKFNNLLKQYVLSLGNRQLQQSLQDYERWQKDGLFLAYLSVFGKQESSQICYKCVKNKSYFFALDDNFRQNAVKVWQTVHSLSLNDVFYDLDYPEKVLNKWNNIVQVLPAAEGINYKILQGAEQIQFNVTSNASSSDSQYIRVSVESNSTTKEITQMVLSKKKEKLNTSFDFYKIFDVVGSNTKINNFDRFAYKKIKVTVGYNKKFKEFQIQIPNFTRLLRLNCQVIVNKEGIQGIKVYDQDYELKKSYYRCFDKCS